MSNFMLIECRKSNQLKIIFICTCLFSFFISLFCQLNSILKILRRTVTFLTRMNSRFFSLFRRHDEINYLKCKKRLTRGVGDIFGLGQKSHRSIMECRFFLHSVDNDVYWLRKQCMGRNFRWRSFSSYFLSKTRAAGFFRFF